MVNHKNDQTPLQKRTTKPAPHLLARLIEIVNKIPPDIELPALDLSKPDYSHYEKWVEERYRQLEANLDKAKDQEQEHFSESDIPLIDVFRAFIRAPQGQSRMTIRQKIDAIENYNNFVNSRENLRLIARSRELIGRHNWNLSIKGGTTASLDKQGTIQVEMDSFSNAINQTDAARIRECLNCRYIFWAGKRNQNCCSDRCANNNRVRKWREKYPDKYKLQRNERAEQIENDSKAKA